MLTPEIAVDLISHAVQITALIVCVLVIPSLIGGLLVSTLLLILAGFARPTPALLLAAALITGGALLAARAGR